MEEKGEMKNNADNYFQKLLNQHPSKDSMTSVLKQTEDSVEHHLEDGSLKIVPSPEKDSKDNNYAISNRKKDFNPFDTNYKGFLLTSDRERSIQRYQFFKKLRAEYSKEKTSVVVKEVQNKIKQWTNKKLEINRRKNKSLQRSRKIEIELLQQLKKQEIEKRDNQKEQKKQEVQRRIKMLEEEREKRKELMKESSVRSLEVKKPKYKEIQSKFSELEEKIRAEQEKAIEERRQAMLIKKEELIQHSKKYAQLLKEKQEERKHKLKVATIKQAADKEKEQFNIFTTENKQQKVEDQQKRKRRKQFNQRMKSMIIITNKSHQQIQNQETGSKLNKSKVSNNHQQSNEVNDSNSPKKIRKRQRRSIDGSTNGRKLGNDYLKQLRHNSNETLNKSVKLPKLTNSTSLPLIKQPTYKNYLTQIKIKRRQVGDQIQLLKRKCQSKAEVFNELSKKSQQYEGSMLKKINELKKINKYDESVIKESEIDQMYSRYIKMRLACIQV